MVVGLERAEGVPELPGESRHAYESCRLILVNDAVPVPHPTPCPKPLERAQHRQR